MSSEPQKPSPSTEPDATREPDMPEDSGGQVGPYRLLQRLGEGGMGEVWLAEQTRPVRRQVALKIIKAGMDTAQVVARFGAERQALALMDHPAIATVFDAGATAQGRPYFAMEYVKGEPITAYCDRCRLSTTERLELFIRVCEGVQHAHQKGIIHRDLKPSNVLVTIQGDKPVPKIIDFGVAKATTQHLAERTLFTELGVLVGTPEYMSPEQADLTALDIDTRSDVYALGVLLYELLTGVLPFDRKTLREQALDEIRRTIREVEPPRPSTRIRQLGSASTAAAHSRHTEPAHLASELRGDLDWITMKTLEKDRTRRYGTASDFAADLRRHLELQPVQASPPSTVYRARKFVRRHRFGVAAAATLVLLLVAFAVTMAVQAQRIARERDRANREAARANQEAAAAKQVSDFLVGLFQVSDPSEARGNSITAREVLDKGAAAIDTKLDGQPETQVRLLDTVGRVYQTLGLYERSQLLTKRRLDIARQVYGENHTETIRALGALCGTLVLRQKLTEAEPVCRQSVEESRRVIGFDDRRTNASVNNLASLLYTQRRYAEAERLFRESLEARRRTPGVTPAEMIGALNNIASVLEAQGKSEEAERAYREALENARVALGSEHPNTLTLVSTLGDAAKSQGKLDEAEAHYRDALEGRRKVLPGTHPSVAVTLVGLADVLNRQGRFAEAEPLAREALTIDQKALPPGHTNTAEAMLALGNALAGLREFKAAEPFLAEGWQSLAGSEAPSAELVLRELHRIVRFYEAWGKAGKAAEWRKKLARSK